MRLLLFYFAELGGLGGVEVAVLTLAEASAKYGISAAIVEIAPQQKHHRVLPNGIPVWSVTAPSYPKLSRVRSWVSFARATLQFQSILRQFRPDVVHIHYPVAQCLPAVGASFFSHHWKLVATVHNSDIRVSPLQEPALGKWQSRLFARADALTAVSQSLLDDASERYLPFRSKARVIHNGVGPRWFQLPLERDTETDYVLFAGRLHPVKGVDVLLTSWKAICSSFPSIELWIAGDGPERNTLEAAARQFSLSNSVRFLGPKTMEELPDLYRNARTVVLPSRREGLPISLLEAGACGAICIGTTTPGIPEIIEDGVTGFLVPPDSPEGLSATLSKVLRLSPDEALEMRQAARTRTVKSFSEERMTQKYMELYSEVLRQSVRG